MTQAFQTISVTTDEAGNALMVSEDNEDGQILRVLWEREQAPAQPAGMMTVEAHQRIVAEAVAPMRAALRGLLAYAERNQCEHEDTYRAGAIWTICSGCGRKWADDEGGFVPYMEPAAITAARDALSGAKE